jgi:cytochrome c556
MALALALLAVGACGKGRQAGEADLPPSPVREVMQKLAKGPGALTSQINRALRAEAPSWESIQPQAREYAQLAASLGQYDPPRGDKQSWTRLTSAYAENAAQLDKAAQAKDKDAALAAHAALGRSCGSCHQAHRGS